MPQLDASTFPSQLFWLTITFVTLYLLLARFLLPRVQSVLTLRADTIGGVFEQAARMKSEAEQARETYEKALAAARAKSQAMLAEAQAAINANAVKQQAELDGIIEMKLAASDVAILSAKQNVMGKLAPVSGELAALIVEVLVHHKPNAKEIGAVIDEISKGRSL